MLPIVKHYVTTVVRKNYILKFLKNFQIFKFLKAILTGSEFVLLNIKYSYYGF